AARAVADIPLAGGLAVFEDPELSLRLGGVHFAAAPWAGPIAWAETADGVPVRVLSDPALHGLAACGADLAQARAWLLGAQDLSEAPGVNHETLRARGFTDHEIAAVEAALPFASRLAEA